MDPRLAGRRGQGGGAGATPNRYPASRGPGLPRIPAGSGYVLVPQAEPGPPPQPGAPPWETTPEGVRYPPFGGMFPTVKAFDAVTPAAGVTIAASVTAIAEVAAFQLPSKTHGVLTALGHECCDTDAWDSLDWFVTVNGSPQPGYFWQDQIAGIESMRLSETYLYVPNGARVAIWARNRIATAWELHGRVKGFYVPVEERY